MTEAAAVAERSPAPAGSARGGGTPGHRRPLDDQSAHRQAADDATWAALGRYLTARAN